MAAEFLKNTRVVYTAPEFCPARPLDGHRQVWNFGPYTVSVVWPTDSADLGGARFEFAVLKDGELIALPKRFGGGTTNRTNSVDDVQKILDMVALRATKENLSK